MKLAALSARKISFHDSATRPTQVRTQLQLKPAPLQSDERDPRELHLTPRELEVLALLCEGLPNKVICRRLNICEGTVKIHVGNILAEFGVTSRLQAVLAAHKLGLTGGSTADVSSDEGELQRAPAPQFATDSFRQAQLRAA